MSNLNKVDSECMLSVNQARRAACVAMMANITVALWGESGIGKSTVIGQLCEKIGFRLFDFRLSDKEPTDVSGVPMPGEDGIIKWSLTDQIPWEEHVGNAKCALFLDEFDRADVSVQNMALQLLLDRKVNGHKLGRNVVIVVAGNGTSDSYTTAISTAVARRMIHLYVTRTGERGLRSYEEYCEDVGVPPEHAGFARFCNESWRGLSESIEFEELGTPSPRTYDMAGRIWDTLADTKARGQFETEDIILPMLAGCVGKAGAFSYIAWRRMCAEAPDPKTVLDDPQHADIPPADKVGILFGLIASVVDTVADQESAEKVSIYLTRVSKANFEELAAMGFRRMIKRFPEAATCPVYHKWEKDHKDLLR